MPAGRPRLLTDDLVERAAELRRDGYSAAAIAERRGLSTRSAYRALVQARDGTTAEVIPLTIAPSLIASIGRAAEGDRRAAAWLLERRWPQRWDRSFRPSIPVPPPSAAFAGVDELCRRRRERSA